MNNKPKNRFRAVAALLLLALALLGFEQRASAVCATVKIQIDQDMAFERQAFEARLSVDNGFPDAALTDFLVTLQFLDKNKVAVTGTTGTTGTDAKFFYQLSSPATMPTEIASGTSQAIMWRIIPTPGAGGTDAAGVPYWVGGQVSYKLNGNPILLDLEPAPITVKPMPKIAMEYFLPEQVIGDDPHTTSVTEPCVPFPLGVRVVNVGAGMARSLTIESGQPEIRENLHNLLVRFQINTCEVNGKAAQPTLLANFGDIGPKAIGMANWGMTASLTGKFKEFTATMTHADDLGGAVTSLLQSPTKYELLGTVRVDLPGRDTVVDFLGRVWDGGAISIHESDQVEAVDVNGNLIPRPVVDFSLPGSSTINADGSRITVNCAVSGSSFGFVRVSDVGQGAKVITGVTRSDGKRILPQNAWLSRTQSLTGSYEWSYYVNVFDTFTTDAFANAGSLYYIIDYGNPPVNHPPVLAPVADLVLKAGGTNRSGTTGYSFTVRATDPDNDPVALTTSGMPIGMTFTDHNNSSGILEWNPTANQTGNYSITVKAFDGKAYDTKVVKVTVTNGSPLDDWKKKYFGNETDPNIVGNQADPDKDGCSNLVEYALGLDPTKPDEEPTLVGVTQVTGADNVTQNHLTLTYVKRTDNSDLSFRVLAGETLRADGTWTEQTTLVPEPSQAAVPAGFERVIVRDSQPIEGGANRRYMKLEVSIP